MKTLLEPTIANIRELQPGTTYFVVMPYRLSQVRKDIYAIHGDKQLHTSYDNRERCLRVVITSKEETDSGS